MRLATGELQIRVGEESDVEAVVLAYRRDGELHELARASPPVEAELRPEEDRQD